MSDEPERGVFTHDFREEAQLMSADNARLCRIIEAADKLAEAVEAQPNAPVSPRKQLRDALDNYRIVRQGQ